uniref:Cysteine-rich venom protein n=1 Tax=Scolopendra mojiangica (nomen nudum) TaxID=2023220 RepID=A0A5B9CTE9_9MYRI|nr:venom allergen [Scolopendra mojiangica (nomen nudum)]
MNFVIIAVSALLTFQLYVDGWGCQMSERGLDKKMKNRIVKHHNELRQKVAKGQERGQPTASNMKQLRWNDELAANAQRAAERCVFQHSSDEERTTTKYGVTGESMYAGTFSNPLKTAVDRWYEEVRDVNPSIVDSYDYYPGAVIGHYIQLVWAETEAIGCGYAKSAADGQSYVFCHYAPRGLYPQQSVYKRGSPASACKKGQSSRYPGLCK